MKLPLGLVLTVGVLLIATTPGHAQTRRNIKVVLDTQQTESLSRDGLQGSGSVIIRRSTVEPSGRVTGAQRQTTVKRSSGIFTLVLDGGESILTVATRVPQSQLSYYRNYALGIGYRSADRIHRCRYLAEGSCDDARRRANSTEAHAENQLFFRGPSGRHRFHRGSDGTDRAQRSARIVRRLNGELARGHPPDSRLPKSRQQRRNRLGCDRDYSKLN